MEQIKAQPVNYLTLSQLRYICPNAPKNVDAFLPYLERTFEKYFINTTIRKAFFLAQVAHESGQFRYTQEIASGKAYEGRLDLGNNIQGDGVKYKGRGVIQITGKANYKAFSKAIFLNEETLLTNPQLLETPQYACLSAGWYWSTKKLNQYCDMPDDWRSPSKHYTPFEMVTYLINGGLNGLEDRKMFLKRAIEVL